MRVLTDCGHVFLMNLVGKVFAQFVGVYHVLRHAVLIKLSKNKKSLVKICDFQVLFCWKCVCKFTPTV